uniref:Uncharacterized protein n=1 Tax=Quercus lobata TaxID=97700 RepID=A0A7N2MSK0_QUELO
MKSSYTSPFGDESREDSSDAELRLSGSTSVSGDGASSPFEGLDRPFILLDEWEVLPNLTTDLLDRIERATSFSTSERNWRVLVTIDNLYKYFSGFVPSAAACHQMEVGTTKKNKKVQEVATLVAAAIKEGKLQLPKPGEKRKFSVDIFPKTFRTVTRLKETPNRPSVTLARSASIDRPREEDIDDCDEYALASIGESGLHDLVKTLELRCGDYEDQVVKLQNHLKSNNEVIKELQGFVFPPTEKVTILEARVKELEEQWSSQASFHFCRGGESTPL